MSWGLGNVGGSLSNAFAVIAVTYPSGSECICYKGSRTPLRAKNDLGKWIFVLPEGGEWTVYCSDNGKSASKTVSVSQYEVKNVTLAYTRYIFKANEGFKEDFSLVGPMSVSSQSLSFTGSAYFGGTGKMYITPAINLSGYSKLYFDAELTYNWGGDYSWFCGIGDASYGNETVDTTNFVTYTHIIEASISRQSVLVDISTVSDTYNIKCGVSYCAGNIYNIWLE